MGVPSRNAIGHKIWIESKLSASFHVVTNVYADTLRHLGVYVTPQRLAVMKAVADHPHGTADVISDAARSEIGTISRQSVYDTLSLLVDNGCIRRIQPVGSPALFESRVGDNHHHLICRDCGRVVDVDCAVGYRPCLEAVDDSGFEIDEAEVAYWGRCPDCRIPATT